jgi:hypothetical protein
MRTHNSHLNFAPLTVRKLLPNVRTNVHHILRKISYNDRMTSIPFSTFNFHLYLCVLCLISRRGAALGDLVRGANEPPPAAKSSATEIICGSIRFFPPRFGDNIAPNGGKPACSRREKFVDGGGN